MAQGRVSQIPLRTCPEEAEGETSNYVILVEGYVQSSIHLGRRLLLVTRNRYLS